MTRTARPLGIVILGAIVLAACAPTAANAPALVSASSTAPLIAATATAEPAPAPTSQPTPTASVIEPEVVRSITGEANPLKQPVDVALDSTGNLFVLDAGNNRVQEFDSQGRPVAMWGQGGQGKGQFSLVESKTGNSVGGIAVDGSDDVYVADAFNDRIQKFDHAGKFVLQWGSKGSADGQFLRPTGVEADPQGNIYVYDALTDAIQKFKADGTFVSRFGGTGGGNKSNDPGYIAVGADGLVYECDAQLRTVEVYDADGRLVGIDIDHASLVVDLSRLDLESLPVSSLSLSKP